MNEEKKITLNMWMARDKSIEESSLCVGFLKPERGETMWHGFGFNLALPPSAFKQVTWKNEPVKVKVTIEIIERNEKNINTIGSNKDQEE